MAAAAAAKKCERKKGRKNARTNDKELEGGRPREKGSKKRNRGAVGRVKTAKKVEIAPYIIIFHNFGNNKMTRHHNWLSCTIFG